MVVDSPPEETVALANTWRLSSVERASMTEQVLRELREAIVEGRIPQGEPLREVSLAATLGTGRSAVREAVRQLIQEGLVDYEPHRGAFVRVMSLADRLHVYRARARRVAGLGGGARGGRRGAPSTPRPQISRSYGRRSRSWPRPPTARTGSPSR